MGLKLTEEMTCHHAKQEIEVQFLLWEVTLHFEGLLILF